MVNLRLPNLPTQSNFALAFLLLPKRKREALEAAYGFCRAVDDAVDEVQDRAEGLRILAEWREKLRLVYEGTPADAQGRALRSAVDGFGIRRRDLEDILLGVEMDLERSRYETFAELYTYCYRVASAVGMVAIEIFGYTHPNTKVYAEKLGLALQLTNILRDVGEDALRGRIYLPLEDLRRFGVSEDDLLAQRYSDGFFDLMAFQAGRAHRFYEEARAALPAGARRKLGAAETMAGIYFELLRAIEARGFRVFGERVCVPTGDKVRIAVSRFIGQGLPLLA